MAARNQVSPIMTARRLGPPPQIDNCADPDKSGMNCCMYPYDPNNYCVTWYNFGLSSSFVYSLEVASEYACQYWEFVCRSA